MQFVKTMETSLAQEGIIIEPTKMEFLPMQDGDVFQTYADVGASIRDFDFKPPITIEEGLSAFAAWYKQYYLISENAQEDTK